MKVQMLFLMLISQLCSAFQDTENEPVVFEMPELGNYAFLLNKAKKENKLVFLSLTSEDCYECVLLNEHLDNKELSNYLEEHYLTLRIKADSSEIGEFLVYNHNVNVFPTVLIMNGEEKILEKVEGGTSVEGLKAYSKKALENWTSMPELLVKYESGELTKDERLQLIDVLEEVDEEKAAELAKSYLGNLTVDDLKDIQNIWLAAKFENQIDGIPYSLINRAKSQIDAWHGEREYRDYMSAVYNDNLALAIKYGDSPLMERLITEVMPTFIGEGDMPKAIYATRSVYYGQREEFGEYRLTVNSYLNNHVAQEQKPEFILATVYDIIDNYPNEDQLKFATNLLVQALEIKEAHFEANSLMGYTHGLLGNYKNAESFLKKAESLAQSESELEMVDNILEALEMMKKGQF